MRIRTWLVAGIALLLGNTSFSQQLKLGDNPYTVQKSAVLELNSTKQGLLLARISDTTAINLLAPPDGMIIFFTPTVQLLVRSNGYWQPLTMGSAITSLNGLTATTQTFATGNTGTNFNISSSGSVHTFNIPDASATARGAVTTAAQTIAGAKTLTSTLQVVTATNPLTLLGVQAGTSTTADSLLTITSGLVRKLPMSTFTATGAAITSLNGLTATTQTFATGNTGTDFNISSSGSTHTFNIPDASATARGALTTGAQTIAGAKTLTSTLQVVTATNPLTLLGVQAGTSTTADSLLTITSGLVRKLPMSTFIASTTNYWALGGNTVTTPSNLGTIDNNDLPFITNNTEKMRLTATGSLGIGTSTPAAPLHISASNGNVLYLQTLTSGTASIIFKTYPATANPSAQISVIDTNYSGHFTFSTKIPGADANAMVERVRINALGNVGIGTTTPGQKLDVKGTIVSSATTYPNYAYNSANRMAFGEPNVPANETGSVAQFGSGSNTRNMLFTFTKTGVNTSYLGNDGTQMMLGSESTIPITFRTGLVYSSANVMASGTEVMRLTSAGLLGIGTAAPATALHVVAATNPLTLIGVQAGTSTTADSLLTITSGLVRKLPMSTFTATGTDITSLNGLTATTQTFATGNTGTDFNISSSGSIHTFNIPDASATARGAVTTGAQTIAGAKTLTSTLQVVTTTNPLTLLGVQAGTSTTADSLLTITSGLVRKLPMSTFATNTSSWSITGNSGTSGSANFLGTTDNVGLHFRTNNTERMYIDSVYGNLGIGSNSFNATAPEKLLVNAGTTTSFNAIVAKGSINNYFQLNVNNLNSGSSASSDVVATADNGTESVNYVDLGINSSTYNTSTITGGANNAYLYSTGNDFVIGNAASGKNLLFFTGGTASSNEAMRINSSGQVGIGTISPATALHVVATTNPLTLIGVQTGTSTTADSLLTITSGLIRKLPMSTFTSGTAITSLNGLTGATQTFATGNTGTDFNISSSGTTHTFNIPDASATARGAITIAAQTIAGAKTFSSAPIFSSLTAGSVPFIGTGGVLSQINTNLFWDATNNRLGIGTNTPASDFTVSQGSSGSSTTRGFRLTGTSIGGTSTGSGFAIALGFNQTNNKQLWLGDADYLGNSTGTFVRYSSSNGSAIFDAVAGDNSVRRSIRLGIGNDPLSTIILGDDGTSTTPGSYIWANGSMAIGNGYRSNSAPGNGLIVQGNTGMGTASPTAALHLRAGTTTASSGAPLKFTSGTNLTTAEDGAVEYNGTNYFVTVGTTRYTLAKTLTATAALDFPSTAGAGGVSSLTITVTGAADGDVVAMGVPNASASTSGVVYTAFVSAANTVTVRFTNNNILPVDPASATFRVSIIKY